MPAPGSLAAYEALADALGRFNRAEVLARTLNSYPGDQNMRQRRCELVSAAGLCGYVAGSEDVEVFVMRRLATFNRVIGRTA